MKNLYRETFDQVHASDALRKEVANMTKRERKPLARRLPRTILVAAVLLVALTGTVLAAVGMYDAIGVRQETGKQARLLNMILEQDLFKLNNHQFQERLKEFVGHTPLQVFAGAVLGILLAVLVNLAY